MSKRTYLQTHELINYVIKVPKKDSVLTYFLLEAHEGLSFYSTLDNPEEDFRIIQISSTIEFLTDLEKLINDFQTMFPVEILNKSIDKDRQPAL